MKKLLVVFCLLFVSSQIILGQNFATKGAIELGGSIGFSSTTAVLAMVKVEMMRLLLFPLTPILDTSL